MLEALQGGDFFSRSRSLFKPKIPPLLKDLSQLESINSDPTDCVGYEEDIRNLFPKTFGQPKVYFARGASRPIKPLKVGVVLSGGQAPGGHNVIAGLFDALRELSFKSELMGFLGGASGVINHLTMKITEECLIPYRNTGGFDLLGSGRAKIETEKQLECSLKVCNSHGLDGLVIIGGDDSNTNAAVLAEFFLNHNCKTKVVGVPKTIDGDLKNEWIETSFGFDTACKIYSEMIGNICRDALSAKKYTHFIKLMGRSASHVALECALQTHPNLTLLGEEVAYHRKSLKEVVQEISEVIIDRAEVGKNYGVIVIPEGLIEFLPEGSITGEMLSDLSIEQDPHGNLPVSQIPTETFLINLVKKNLKARGFQGQFSPVAHFLGYEGRCGYPSYFDATYSYLLGRSAALLIHQGLTGYMSVASHLTQSVENWEVSGLPITSLLTMEERKGKIKPVIKKALVDLKGKPFQFFASHRQQWEIEDHYRYPGPIQFEGAKEVVEEITYTLRLEHSKNKALATPLN